MKFNLFKRNLLKRNQIVIYAIALMLVTAGYLNFTSLNESKTQETASTGIGDENVANSDTAATENNTDTSNTVKEEAKVADIGDAALVNSNDVVKESPANKESNNKETSANAENSNTNKDAPANTENKAEVQETASSATSSDDYFTKSKLERDTMYSQMLETYEKVLNSSNSLETQRQTATQEISKINETKNSIMVCENLIGTKGFKNNVIFVNGNSINAIIGTNQLKPEEIAQIQNIVSREMKAEIENIHIAMK